MIRVESRRELSLADSARVIGAENVQSPVFNPLTAMYDLVTHKHSNIHYVHSRLPDPNAPGAEAGI